MKPAHSPVKSDQSTKTRSGRPTVAPARHNPDASPSQQKTVSAKQRKGATVSNRSQQVAEQPTPSQPEQPLTSTTGFDQIQIDFTARFEQIAEAQSQKFADLVADLSSRVREEVALQLRAEYDPVIQDMQQQIDRLQARMDQPQNSTSHSDTAEQVVRQPAQIEQAVHRLTDLTQQQQDKDDSKARQQKEKNAVLRNFPKSAEETQESLQGQVDDLLSTDMGLSVSCAGARRVMTKADAAQGLVIVQFKSKEDKKTVFRAKGKLRGNPTGLDDDLTQLQQKRKQAAWSAFKAAKAAGKRTQWRAEKLFIMEGERFVEHKVLDL